MADDDPIADPTSTSELAERAADELGMADEVETFEEAPAEEIPAEDAPTEAAPEEAPVEAEPPAPEAVVSEEAVSDAAQFLLAQGHKPKKVDGRDVWLPYKTVEKMLDRYAGKAAEPLTGEKAQLAERVQTYEQQLAELRQGVAGDPEAFLRELASIDPRYGQYLQQQATPRQQEQPAADDPMPEPDLDLGNGRRTYSLKGLQARDEWVQRQAERRILSQVDERLSTRDRQAQTQQQSYQRAQQQVAEAETWPMFGPYTPNAPTDFQKEVFAAFKADTRATLRQAYLEVYAKHNEPDKVRARVLAEMKQAPRSTAVGVQPTDAPRKTGPPTTAAAAARAYDRLDKGA